jgi:hypothetical protein
MEGSSRLYASPPHPQGQAPSVYLTGGLSWPHTGPGRLEEKTNFLLPVEIKKLMSEDEQLEKTESFMFVILFVFNTGLSWKSINYYLLVCACVLVGTRASGRVYERTCI